MPLPAKATAAKIALVLGLIPLVMSFPKTSVEAQTAAPLSDSETLTECLYAPDMGEADPLGGQGAITVREVEGDTEFRYEPRPVPVTNPAQPQPSAFVIAPRILVFSGTPLAEARTLLFESGYVGYYNALIGRDAAEPVSAEELQAVDANLVCRPANGGDAAAPSLSDLPDGNYRVVSAQFPPNRIVSDAELIEAGGALFLFRKAGNTVTGFYSFIDHEGGACVSGTLAGDAVTGQAYTYREFVRDGIFLTLGDAVENNRYDGSVLDLSSFSLINAGSRLPVERCP